jgi:hypothetical protein
MDEIDSKSRQIKLKKLEALLIVYDVELASLRFEIDSPWIDSKSRTAATARRDAVLIEWGKTMTALQDLRTPSAADDKRTLS